MSLDEQSHELAQHGFAMLEGAFTEAECGHFAARLRRVLECRDGTSTLRSRGFTYGSRNLLEAFPESGDLLGSSRLKEFASTVLTHSAGVVRVLYFDKPPGRAWSLPWHQDRTIAVQKNDLPSESFLRPTLKSGVPHVEAPAWLLERMLTLRIHLDAMTPDNGPLCVMPGSHLEDDQVPVESVELRAHAGDVLAMRPLLSHSSRMPLEGVATHRRIIHIELAQDVDLPDGYQWHSYIPL